MLPALLRPGGTRRGQVILSQDEAWELMATTGPRLQLAGFDVRVPELSRRASTPSLRVFVDAVSETAVGANQLADVRWSAVFDDVELTAADIARLAKEARPLVRSGGRWVALDQADLKAAADALAERDATTQLSGAEMLRLALGLEDSPLAGGISIEGGGWAADLLAAARDVRPSPRRRPKGFVGELRSYQAEALAWLGFLDSAGLGGCLALDMGLGKTPTMLAHLLADAGDGPALVIAPPAVVGNWAAEAARFTPDAARRRAPRREPRRARRDRGRGRRRRRRRHHLRHRGARRRRHRRVEWARVVLDEAQAIKNPANDTSQQLRRIPARTRIALTGTPIENGLGDLWAILDFTNPGLVGPRPQFIARLSSDGSATRVEAEDAMRALNGILVFRRTKAEPEIAAELPDQIDELDHCAMTAEQIGLYQAVLDTLVTGTDAARGRSSRARARSSPRSPRSSRSATTRPRTRTTTGRSRAARASSRGSRRSSTRCSRPARRVLVFTHFAEWGDQARRAPHRDAPDADVACYHGGLSRTARDRIIDDFQAARARARSCCR